MPQLDTSTWFMTIALMILSLFCMYQSKMINQTMISIPPQQTKTTLSKQNYTEKQNERKSICPIHHPYNL
uniref:ATP synthase complex subunit 8 n=1 Tax=Bettongia penicillata TaxID=69259 RepID=A0A075R0G4_BETPE|nr:ATP synthase F0 subunit 8 [Bettongia penicillata]